SGGWRVRGRGSDNEWRSCGHLRWRAQRQCERDDRAAAGAALRADAAAVGLDQAARDREPEPGALRAPAVPTPDERIEESGADVVADARPVVGDTDPQIVGRGARPDPD